MEIVAKARRESMSDLGWCLRVGTRAAGLDRYASQLHQPAGPGWAIFRVMTIDLQYGADGGIADRCTGAEHDQGERRRDYHEVSQRNGCGLVARGTAATSRRAS